MCHFNKQELCNTAWAFTMMDQQDVQLFTALSRMAEWLMGESKAQDLATTAWALTESAACALENGSNALGPKGELVVRYLLTMFWAKPDTHPKSGHFSFQNRFCSTQCSASNFPSRIFLNKSRFSLYDKIFYTYRIVKYNLII